MRNIVYTALIFALPLVSYAGAITVDTATILNYYTFASALFVGITTSILVFLNSRKMKGGIFGTVLRYFSFGMILLLISFMINSFGNPSASEIDTTKIVQDVLFIVSYTTMAIASSKLSSATA